MKQIDANLGKNPEEIKKLANELFAKERTVFYALHSFLWILILAPLFITFFIMAPLFGYPLPDVSTGIKLFFALLLPFGAILVCQFGLVRRFAIINRCMKKQEYSYHYLDIVKCEKARGEGFNIMYCLDGHEYKTHTNIDGAKKVHVIDLNGELLCKVDSNITEQAIDEIEHILS